MFSIIHRSALYINSPVRVYMCVRKPEGDTERERERERETKRIYRYIYECERERETVLPPG